MIKAWTDPMVDHIMTDINGIDVEIILDELAALVREVIVDIQDLTGMSEEDAIEATEEAVNYGIHKAELFFYMRETKKAEKDGNL